MPLVGEKANWVKSVSLGLCDEEVCEKVIPRTASGIKTFKPIYSLEKILKMVHLVALDVTQKIKEHLEDK